MYHHVLSGCCAYSIGLFGQASSQHPLYLFPIARIKATNNGLGGSSGNLWSIMYTATIPSAMRTVRPKAVCGIRMGPGEEQHMLRLFTLPLLQNPLFLFTTCQT